jgi:hypothetical protein
MSFAAVSGNPGTSADEADVKVKVRITDVRKKSDLTDYTGQVQASFDLRITDTMNGPTLSDSATVQDTPLRYTVPCAPTASTTIGSTCSLTTTADAVTAGTVREGRRSVWALGPARVFDGGADGLASTSPNLPFMRQGIFVP